MADNVDVVTAWKRLNRNAWLTDDGKGVQFTLPIHGELVHIASIDLLETLTVEAIENSMVDALRDQLMRERSC